MQDIACIRLHYLSRSTPNLTQAHRDGTVFSDELYSNKKDTL